MIGETEMQIFVKKTDRNTNITIRNIYLRGLIGGASKSEAMLRREGNLSEKY